MAWWAWWKPPTPKCTMPAVALPRSYWGLPTCGSSWVRVRLFSFMVVCSLVGKFEGESGCCDGGGQLHAVEAGLGAAQRVGHDCRNQVERREEEDHARGPEDVVEQGHQQRAGEDGGANAQVVGGHGSSGVLGRQGDGDGRKRNEACQADA